MAIDPDDPGTMTLPIITDHPTADGVYKFKQEGTAVAYELIPGTVPSALMFLEDHLLKVMLAKAGGTFGPLEICYTFRSLESTGIPREILRGLLRSLTDDGYCYYMRGLWTEGGEPAGAGYGLTRKGVERAEDILRGSLRSLTEGSYLRYKTSPTREGD